MDIWSVLGIPLTQDPEAIRRAYAARVGACHPEEDPEGFLRLRQAYQEALAGGKEAPPVLDEEDGEDGEGWTLSDRLPRWGEGPNPFAEHQAARDFLARYTGKGRTDSKGWLDYFTSGPFLDVAWERRFAGFLLEQVLRLEETLPPSREFLHWLSTFYPFTVEWTVRQEPDGGERTEYHFRLEEEDRFDGQAFICELLRRSPRLRPLQGVERALAGSVREYRALVRMAEEGRWSEEELRRAGHILECYTLSSIQDKGPGPRERHPAGMRLMTHFFRREGLPRALYAIAWEKLELKTARMGRAALLYGPLRELVLERYPNMGEDALDIRGLNRAFEAFRQRVLGLEGTGQPGDWERAGEEVRAFLARPEVQKGLWDRRFAEDHMKHHIQWCGRHFTREMLDFYQRHPEAPCAEELLRLQEKRRRRLEAEARNREDEDAPAGEMTLSVRPFLRHWLNTGFFHAWDRGSGQPLSAYLERELPYLPGWSLRFLGVEGEAVPMPKRLRYRLEGEEWEVRFHLRYMSFLRDGEPVYRPCLPWERTAALEDGDLFFFLLPVTAAAQDRYEEVRGELCRRLRDTALPGDGVEAAAACLADQVCALPRPGEAGLAPEGEREVRPLAPESVLPFEVFGEDAQHLFVCVWREDLHTLTLFQQTPEGRRMVWRDPDEDGPGVPDPQSAIALSAQLLEEQLFPKGFPLEALKALPQAVYAKWDYAVRGGDEGIPPGWAAPVELLGEAVTGEKLAELLALFARGRMERLEWSWPSAIPLGEEQGYEPRRSLVFLKEKGWYACLCFDDRRAESFALLEQPERFGKLAVEFFPFRQSRMFRQDVHRSFATIRRQLDTVFSQASTPNGVGFLAGGVWDHAVNVSHGRGKYNLDKQLLGGFPMERAHNRLDMPFYFACYPHSAALAGQELEVTDRNRYALQGMLARFLAGEGSRLRLTWGREAGRRRHILLLRDGMRFLLAWVSEAEERVDYHVADRWAYVGAEGKQYPKESFQGRTVPAYLVHGPVPLRNALDLLLANLGTPELLLGEMGEYAKEKPKRARPYAVQWEELVGDGRK